MLNNILFIAPSNSIHSHKWISFFDKQKDLKISWISFYKKDSNIEISPSINYYELSNHNALKIFLFLLKLIKKEKFSIVHLHYLGKFSYVTKFINIKSLIVSPWGSDIKLLKKNSIKYFIVRKILNSSDLITVDADYMFSILNSISRKNNLNIKRINFGTDTNFFKPNNKHKVFNKPIKIISLRNLEKIYSVETIIKAAKILRDKFKIQFKIDIYGDGSEKGYLMQMINKLSLDNFVSLKGKYQYDNLPTILNKYDLYISSSTSDAGLAASTSEAMSCGIIPIVSNNSENEFWMSNNSGYLYETYSYKDLANKIMDFINLEYESKLKLFQNARDKIIDFNSYENEMSKMLNIYKKLNESN
tara:strand:+ start:5875 stop:6954 length:1080 start_codon:yes stop_codon:yes gene_type:complete